MKTKTSILILSFILLFCLKTEDSKTINYCYETTFGKSELNIIIVGSHNYFTIYGASMGEIWLSPMEIREKLKADIPFTIFDEYKEIGMYTAPLEFEEDEYCDCPMWTFENLEDVRYHIGITGNWNIYPRDEFIEIEDYSEYNKYVLEHLSKYEYDGFEATIQNMSIIDLDGDGKDDAIIDAANIMMENYSLTKAGSYSIIILVFDVDGSSQIATIHSVAYTEDVPGEMEEIFDNEYTALADLNGDGVYEIIITAGYYEGGGEDIYTLIDDKPEGVLGCMCGT